MSVFWDNSNIWLVGRGLCVQREPGDELAFRIHFGRLLDFVLDGRQLDYAFVGGSIPPPNDDLWKQVVREILRNGFPGWAVEDGDDFEHDGWFFRVREGTEPRHRVLVSREFFDDHARERIGPYERR